MQCPLPELHMTSERLHELAPVRTHSDLMRTILKGLSELAQGGVITRKGGALGVYFADQTVIAEEYHYVDSMNRERVALKFGSWLCLALALKVSREDTRLVLLQAVKRHPIY
ncbi:hypothetical protein [Pseudomonas phage vB_PaeM-G11]|uniref:Uncharacterized protein n=1 Tax=Pseudomonas phage vB_PaeM-G11 TaxID=3034915 RepID=A0AAF0CXF3_9CAUD|nr:hypothetical protein [Pseudomonas sp. D3]WEM05592.1 hypothetical protein [Pseudomonas phage vB_PaeM-G11]WET13025.1 hypothetical protein P3S72_13135 [Pseudomonas sp. D3]